jgi:hypothetical protein
MSGPRRFWFRGRLLSFLAASRPGEVERICQDLRRLGSDLGDEREPDSRNGATSYFDLPDDGRMRET